MSIGKFLNYFQQSTYIKNQVEENQLLADRSTLVDENRATNIKAGKNSTSVPTFLI